MNHRLVIIIIIIINVINIIIVLSLIALHNQNKVDPMRSKKASSIFSMDIENTELVKECSSEHLRKGTKRVKLDKETEEESKQKTVTAGTKKDKSRRPNCIARAYSPSGVAIPKSSG